MWGCPWAGSGAPWGSLGGGGKLPFILQWNTHFPVQLLPSPVSAAWNSASAWGGLGQPGNSGNSGSGQVGHSRVSSWRRHSPTEPGEQGMEPRALAELEKTEQEGDFSTAGGIENFALKKNIRETGGTAMQRFLVASHCDITKSMKK